jgi:hypothetical protein
MLDPPFLFQCKADIKEAGLPWNEAVQGIGIGLDIGCGSLRASLTADAIKFMTAPHQITRGDWQIL